MATAKQIVELPCKLGDKIFEACNICNKVYERTVTGFKIGIGGNLILTDTKNFVFREIGTDVFFNREEAETALKGK